MGMSHAPFRLAATDAWLRLRSTVASHSWVRLRRTVAHAKPQPFAAGLQQAVQHLEPQCEARGTAKYHAAIEDTELDLCFGFPFPRAAVRSEQQATLRDRSGRSRPDYWQHL